MPNEQTENLKVRDYLLGLDQNGEQEKIEERLLTDDQFFEEFLATEEDLIQDYVDGDLTETEKKQFENHFLISPERQEKLKFAQSLRRNLDSQTIEEAESETTEESNESESSQSFLQKLFGSSLLANPVPAFALVVVLVGVVGISVYYFAGGDNLSPLESEFAELNKSDFSDLEKYKNSPNLNLLPGKTRDASVAKSLPEAVIEDKVFFRLALPTQTESDEIFTVELQKSQKTIFTQNQVRAYKNKDGEELRFFIPASVLEKGNYQIKAKSKRSSNLSYPFSIQ